ncbi:MAG: tetratricopeptide repeat protein [Fimbriimonadaceae bacterium]|nr:tetratricopeptide repeat protein [Fimbriimonadaceae bacterium]QYK56034.1 MAG: tetratricopeptide repeat protein [Fimbriimonadaceae bacterium]
MPLTSEEIDALWNFADPSESEARFRRALEEGGGTEVQTQLARSLGLQRRFDEAQAVLDGLEGEMDTPLLKARYALEQGRVLNSSQKKEEAVAWFETALARAIEADEDFYAVDAMHMLGIASPPEDALDWNLKAIAAAEASAQPRAKKWLGSLLNNTAWTLHDMGRLDEALGLFEKALAFRREHGTSETQRIAEWSVARCLRSLGRTEEALSRQRALLAEDPDGGYTYEEIAECLLALGQAEEAKPHFARAHEILSRDEWLVANEPARLERLKSLSMQES